MYIYMFIYLYVYIYTCIHKYIHTYIHTYIYTCAAGLVREGRVPPGAEQQGPRLCLFTNDNN